MKTIQCAHPPHHHNGFVATCRLWTASGGVIYICIYIYVYIYMYICILCIYIYLFNCLGFTHDTQSAQILQK